MMRFFVLLVTAFEVKVEVKSACVAFFPLAKVNFT